MRRVRNEEEEIPKSVLKMKQDKERREAAKRNNAQYNKINKSEPSRNARETKNSKADKKRKKALKRKVILIIILILLVALGIFLGISAHNWKKISTAMFTNKNSIVLDKNGEVIAELGNEQKKWK